MASRSVTERRVPWRRGISLLAVALIAAGIWHGASGVWLYAKAALAQQLITQAWQQQLRRGTQPRPWPWADTYPVARLSWPRGDVELIALAGLQGEALAFGPGLVDGGGDSGGIVIAGHRDTHFRFLADVAVGDELLLQRRDGARRYRIESLRVVDSAREPLRVDGDELVLVTCYPFGAIRAGGSLRYRVGARPLPTPATDLSSTEGFSL